MKVLRSKYLVSYIGYKGMKRTEPLEIPEAALREIIYNSLIHRLYTGTFVQMKVYNDRVSVWNEGTLPEGFPVEMLMQEHSSRQRNPLSLRLGAGASRKFARLSRVSAFRILFSKRTAAVFASPSSVPVTSPTLAQ